MRRASLLAALAAAAADAPISVDVTNALRERARLAINGQALGVIAAGATTTVRAHPGQLLVAAPEGSGDDAARLFARAAARHHPFKLVVEVLQKEDAASILTPQTSSTTIAVSGSSVALSGAIERRRSAPRAARLRAGPLRLYSRRGVRPRRPARGPLRDRRRGRGQEGARRVVTRRCECGSMRRDSYVETELRQERVRHPGREECHLPQTRSPHARACTAAHRARTVAPSAGRRLRIRPHRCDATR